MKDPQKPETNQLSFLHLLENWGLEATPGSWTFGNCCGSERCRRISGRNKGLAVCVGSVWRWWVASFWKFSNWKLMDGIFKTVFLVVKSLFSRANLLLVEMAVFGSMWFYFWCANWLEIFEMIGSSGRFWNMDSWAWLQFCGPKKGRKFSILVQWSHQCHSI